MSRIERIARLFPLLTGRMGRLRTLVHEGMDLTYNQYKTLFAVAEKGELSLGDLARELDVAMSSASQMIDRLVGQGLVRREQVAENRRQVVIGLTPAGEAMMEELQQSILDGYGKVLARLPDPEQEELVRSFETISRILSRIQNPESRSRER